MVLKHVLNTSATPPKSYIRGKLGVEEFAVSYPPNGVIPFHGFTMYGKFSLCHPKTSLNILLSGQPFLSHDSDAEGNNTLIDVSIIIVALFDICYGITIPA